MKENSNRAKAVVPRFDDFSDSSGEIILHYLRFYAFKSVSDKEKQDLFMDLKNVPLRHPPVFRAISNAVESDNFDALRKLANEKISTDEIVSEIAGKKMKLPDSWPIILDGYFGESDPDRALTFLTELIFFQITDEKCLSLKSYISYYLKSDPAKRDYLLPKQINNYFKI